MNDESFFFLLLYIIKRAEKEGRRLMVYLAYLARSRNADAWSVVGSAPSAIDDRLVEKGVEAERQSPAV